MDRNKDFREPPVDKERREIPIEEVTDRIVQENAQGASNAPAGSDPDIERANETRGGAGTQRSSGTAGGGPNAPDAQRGQSGQSKQGGQGTQGGQSGMSEPGNQGMRSGQSSQSGRGSQGNQSSGNEQNSDRSGKRNR